MCGSHTSYVTEELSASVTPRNYAGIERSRQFELCGELQRNKEEAHGFSREYLTFRIYRTYNY